MIILIGSKNSNFQLHFATVFEMIVFLTYYHFAIYIDQKLQIVKRLDGELT